MARTETGRRLDLLREHVLAGTFGEFTDEELLELLLASVLHRHDIQPLVAELMKQFGSLPAVFLALPRDLQRVKGVGEAVAVLIKLVAHLCSTRPDLRLVSNSSASQTDSILKDLPLFTNIPLANREPEDGSERSRRWQVKTPPSGEVRAPQLNSRQGIVRAIQDLIWKEALLALPWSERFHDMGAYQAYIRENLPQNSLSTRDRYAQTLVRWFFADGIRGLAAEVWRHYRDLALVEEILRYLYLAAEPIVGAVVADALFPISEDALITDSYIPQFVRDRFGTEIPAKTIERLRSNLRKLGYLAYGQDRRDTLRALNPSPTSFLLVLHHRFAFARPSGVEFRTMVSDPFWKYLGFKSEDQLRAILREAMDRGLIAKYVVADRIESISLRYSFHEFVEGRMRP